MAKYHGFTKTRLLDFYRTMTTARVLDDKMLTLLRQGKATFHVGGAGHEAAQVAAASCFKPGNDWAMPYYRDAAFALQWGMTPREQLLSYLGRADDPTSGGRQMPQHYSTIELRIPPQSAATGTQFLQAVGLALGVRKEGRADVVYVSAGDGATSEGDFHEALNWASREKLGVIFFIEDNAYAISTHVSQQTAGGSSYKISAGYESLARFEVNGSDFFETRLAFEKAVKRARLGEGPAIIVAHVPRLMPHSSSDDQRKYRDPQELEEDRQHDPLPLFRQKLVEEGIATDQELDDLEKKVRKKVDGDARWALEQAVPDPATARLHVYDEQPVVDGTPHTEPTVTGKEVMMVDAINHALREELAFNDKLIIYGQDVADKKGGVFGVTRHLSEAFGTERVFNAPLAESSIVGTAIGLAEAGWHPVVEIQFADYIWTATMQLRNELSTLRFRSNNSWNAPIVIRVPVGGYIHGGPYHSQSIDGFFTHMPGFRIAYPSTAADAKGLLKTACRMDDPVIFMEHKGLYRQRYAASPEPDADYLLAFGRARVVEVGEAATIITWGATVQMSLEAAKQVRERSGKTVEVIDLRTLNPLDMDTVLASVAKTSRALVVHEDLLTGGFGAEIAARIADVAFESLDAPVKRVGAFDAPVVPFCAGLEEQILPQTSWIESALKELLNY